MAKKPTKEQFRQLLVSEAAAWEQRKREYEHKRDALSFGSFEREKEQEEVTQCAARHSYAEWLLAVFDGELSFPE